MWLCLGPCHSRPKDTFAFVKVCHSRFALCGNANEPFHCDLKIVEAILVAITNIFSQKTIKIFFKLNKIKITNFFDIFFVGNYYKQQSIILNIKIQILKYKKLISFSLVNFFSCRMIIF